MADELTLQLTVTGTQGAPRVPLKILPTVTATELRQKVSEATSIPLSSLRLIFRGKLIADDAGKQAVEEFKLEEGSVLHCMGKPSSGPAVSREESATALPGSALPSAGPRMTIPPVAAISRVSPLSPTVSDPFKNSLQALRASNSSADYLTAVTTLEKILNNITQHPMEEKYRKVKKDNPAFQRRLGALAAGDLVMQAAGFTTSIENGEEVYLLQQSAEAWPRLLASKAAVSAAVNEAKGAPRPPVVPQAPLLGPVAGDSAAMPFGHTPATQDAMTSLFSDPSALQNMMQVRTTYTKCWATDFVAGCTSSHLSVFGRIPWYSK